MRLIDAVAYVRARRAVKRAQDERREEALLVFESEKRGTRVLAEALLALALLAVLLLSKGLH